MGVSGVLDLRTEFTTCGISRLAHMVRALPFAIAFGGKGNGQSPDVLKDGCSGAAAAARLSKANENELRWTKHSAPVAVWLNDPDCAADTAFFKSFEVAAPLVDGTSVASGAAGTAARGGTRRASTAVGLLGFGFPARFPATSAEGGGGSGGGGGAPEAEDDGNGSIDGETVTVRFTRTGWLVPSNRQFIDEVSGGCRSWTAEFHWKPGRVPSGGGPSSRWHRLAKLKEDCSRRPAKTCILRLVTLYRMLAMRRRALLTEVKCSCPAKRVFCNTFMPTCAGLNAARKRARNVRPCAAVPFPFRLTPWFF